MKEVVEDFAKIIVNHKRDKTNYPNLTVQTNYPHLSFTMTLS